MESVLGACRQMTVINVKCASKCHTRFRVCIIQGLRSLCYVFVLGVRSLEGLTVIASYACKCGPTEHPDYEYVSKFLILFFEAYLSNNNLIQISCLSEGEVRTRDTHQKHY